MISQIDAIATDARKVVTNNENPAKCYLKTKELEYEYFEVLKTYVPMMLEKQEFFKSAFHKKMVEQTPIQDFYNPIPAFVVYVRMCFTLIFQMYCWI